jgi:hypothetical protein
MGPLTNHDESESGLSNTLPGHRAGSPSLLTLLGPGPKAAAGVTTTRAPHAVHSPIGPTPQPHAACPPMSGSGGGGDGDDFGVWATTNPNL